MRGPSNSMGIIDILIEIRTDLNPLHHPPFLDLEVGAFLHPRKNNNNTVKRSASSIQIGDGKNPD